MPTRQRHSAVASKSFARRSRPTGSAIPCGARSPFVETTIGRTFDIRLDKAVPYEIDGGVRKKTKRLKCKVVPGAITVRVPREEGL